MKIKIDNFDEFENKGKIEKLKKEQHKIKERSKEITKEINKIKKKGGKK